MCIYNLNLGGEIYLFTKHMFFPLYWGDLCSAMWCERGNVQRGGTQTEAIFPRPFASCMMTSCQ